MIILAIVNHMIVRHVVAMAHFMEQIRTDKLGPPLRLNRSKHREKDEIQMVSSAINHLQDRLLEKIVELENHGNQLHDLVQERTRELSLSEESYRTIFNAANDAISIHDVEGGRIMNVNTKMVEMYGFQEKSELIGHDVGRLSSGRLGYRQEDASKWVSKTKSDTFQLFEWEAKAKNGRLFPVEVNLKRVVITGNERILAVVRDISEQKRGERELLLAKEEAENANRVKGFSWRI